MPGPLNEVFNSQPGSDLTIPWREFISVTGSTAVSAWGNDGGSAQMTIDFLFPDRRSFIALVLGFATKGPADGDGYPTLQRQLPMRHPDFPWLYASGISDLRGVDWQGKDAGAGAGPYSDYQVCRATVHFTAPPYRIAADGTVPNEYNRFVLQRTRPSVEFAASDRDYFQFTSGPSYNANSPSFHGSYGLKVGKISLQYTWFGVPDNYLFNSNGLSPAVDNTLGMVNSSTFDGYTAGTLFFEGVEYEPMMFSVDPVGVLGYSPGYPPRGWNVTYTFIYFAPGWNTAPDIDRNYYPIVTSNKNGATGGQPPYQSADFSLLFKGTP
jgi:hypothetical protein